MVWSGMVGYSLVGAKGNALCYFVLVLISVSTHMNIRINTSISIRIGIRIGIGIGVGINLSRAFVLVFVLLPNHRGCHLVWGSSHMEYPLMSASGSPTQETTL